MSISAAAETCDCAQQHPTPTGRCENPSVRSEDPDNTGLAGYTACGCCMADCPDVHPQNT